MNDILNLARLYGPADNISEGKAHHLSQLLEGLEAVTGSACQALGVAIVRELKRIPGWPSALKGPSRTNCRHSWVIVSYHHRAQLCWEWSVWLSVGKDVRLRSWKPWNWLTLQRSDISFGVPWLFQISLHRQSYGWMVSGDAKNLISFVAAHYAQRRAELNGEWE